jgi:cysteine synthase
VAVLIIGLMSTGTCYASARYITTQENLALIAAEPNSVCISEQQSAELIIQKKMPNGNVKDLNLSEVKWDFNSDNIARIDGNRIMGLNEGETEILGKYRNKVIKIGVSVKLFS